MKKPFLIVAALTLCLLSAACGTATKRPSINPQLTGEEAEIQKEMSARHSLEQISRLYGVQFALRRAGAPICGEKTTTAYGMLVACAADMGEGWTEAYSRVLGSPDHMVVVTVATDSPAESSGIMKGDRILAMNGEEAPAKDTTKWYSGQIEKSLAGGMDLTVLRGDERMTMRLTPCTTCAFPARMVHNSEINAYADGKGIVVYSGMISFTKTDDELALIVGHELAHDAMGHLEDASNRAMAGIVVGVILGGFTGVDISGLLGQIGAQAYSQEYEHEADYVGLYFAARAGYDIGDAPNLWRRMAVEYPNSITHASTHPTTAERFTAMAAEAEEIRTKQENGEPLLPELKKEQEEKKEERKPDPQSAGDS